MAPVHATRTGPDGAERMTVRGPSGEQAQMTVARTIDAVEALRPKLERLPPEDVDADIDFFLTVVKNRESVLHPHVLLFELSDGREIAVVARVEQQLGSRRLGGRPLRRLQVAFGGIVGAETPADYELVVDALRNILADDEADLVTLSHIEEGAPLCGIARSGLPWWRVDHMPAKAAHWFADVPDSLDAFIGSRGKNTRNNLRRYARALLRDHGDALTVGEFSEPAHLDRLITSLREIAATSYQGGLGVGYTGDRLQLALMELAARRGWLRARVLYIAETPIAFVFGYCYRGTFHLVATSFDPAYSRQHVGLYIQMQMMDGLCREGDVRMWDFGVGDAEYKQRLGDRQRSEANILLFAPSVKAVGYNAVTTARVAASSAAKTWIADSELGGRLKKAWRKNAQRRARSLVDNR